MSLPVHLALVSESATVSMADVMRVGAALQKQLAVDLAPLWGCSGTVNAFASLDDVPPGYWPIVIRDDIGEDAAGFHCDDNGQPMALVTSGPDLCWSVTASHEAIEMVVDPAGNRLVSAPSLKSEQGSVEYLVEVADPVSDQTYLVNGVKVSDFCTPRFFDALKADGVQYSHGGGLKGPRQIGRGGYVTWFEPTLGEWWQQSWFDGDQPAIVNMGKVQRTTCGLRHTIDGLARQRKKKASRSNEELESLELRGLSESMASSGRAKANRWRSQIALIAEKHRR